jgi:hypothetical protein
MTTILDPTDERIPVRRNLATRPEELSGTVAFLDISKPRGNKLIDRLEFRLKDEAPGVTVKRYAKPTFTKPAPTDLLNQIKEDSDFVIEALAD